jgi:hypothetical protein
MARLSAAWIVLVAGVVTIPALIVFIAVLAGIGRLLELVGDLTGAAWLAGMAAIPTLLFGLAAGVVTWLWLNRRLAELVQKIVHVVPRAHPHDAPDLEAQLPTIVAGQPLTRWSLAGENFFRTMGMREEELAELEREARAEGEPAPEFGSSLDVFARAVAGRAELTATPNFVIVDRVRGQPAHQTGVMVDHPEAGSFAEIELGGKTVLRGDRAMMEQNRHQRGRPYIYYAGELRFTVVSEDESWAAAALTALR